MVIGAGGIGCPAIQYLAAAGVGRLTVVDDDRVSLSNLQRQTLYGAADIGRLKVEAVGEACARLNGDVVYRGVPQRLGSPSDIEFVRDAALVLDGSDNFATRLLVNDLCLEARVTLVSAAIGQFHGQIGTFRGWLADKPCYRCFVGDAHDPDDCDNCAELGVLGAMTGLIGSFAAMEAIRAMTGFGAEAAGRLHVFDGTEPSMRTIRLPKDPGCSSCGG